MIAILQCLLNHYYASSPLTNSIKLDWVEAGGPRHRILNYILGGDEWIRAQFRMYVLCLLRTVLNSDQDQTSTYELHRFNSR